MLIVFYPSQYKSRNDDTQFRSCHLQIAEHLYIFFQARHLVQSKIFQLYQVYIYGKYTLFFKVCNKIKSDMDSHPLSDASSGDGTAVQDQQGQHTNHNPQQQVRLGGASWAVFACFLLTW